MSASSSSPASPLFKMKTIMFIEEEKDKERMVIGYHLNRNTYRYAPLGTIRIARFTNTFWPQKNKGYYGDIYMKSIVKRWKNNKKEKEKLMLGLVLSRKEKFSCDIYNIILEFI